MRIKQEEFYGRMYKPAWESFQEFVEVSLKKREDLIKFEINKADDTIVVYYWSE